MDFDPRLRACVRRWHLRVDGQLAGGARSAVVGCVAAGGTEVVVKLNATRAEARAEAAALTAWARTGAAARLLDADLDHGALLLERVRPGTRLPGNDVSEATEVAACLLGALHRAPVPAFPFPALPGAFARMERQARGDAAYEQRTRSEPERGQPGLRRLPLARAAVTRLCASPNRTVLLHGDFLAKNLLSNGTGYVAIDPIPAIGDPCADIGFFAAGHPPAATIRRRAGAIAELMGLEPRRAQRWASVWAVLQASQAWRDDQSDLDAALSTAEFDHLIRALRRRLAVGPAVGRPGPHDPARGASGRPVQRNHSPRS
jgi:streptomycin 6-kinase